VATMKGKKTRRSFI